MMIVIRAGIADNLRLLAPTDQPSSRKTPPGAANGAGYCRASLGVRKNVAGKLR